MMLKIIILAIGIIVSQTGCAENIYGEVVSVADGDTITLLDKTKKQTKIRFAGIDCPEKRQPWGQKAKQATASLVFRKQITVDVVSKDKYGRSVGVVYADGVNVNRLLVKRGHCWVYAKYAKDPLLFKYHNQAKRNKRGLWSNPNAIEPYSFRLKNK